MDTTVVFNKDAEVMSFQSEAHTYGDPWTIAVRKAQMRRGDTLTGLLMDRDRNCYTLITRTGTYLIREEDVDLRQHE
jgi:hypothetical protein